MKNYFLFLFLFALCAFTFSQSVNLVYPPQDTTIKSENIDFNCSITNSNGIDSAILWTDISGTLARTSTQKAPAGEYIYDQSMQLWMHLNNENSIIQDFSDNEHNGTVNGATFSANGHLDGAYNFAGNDNITMAASDFNLPDQTGATIAAWVYPRSGQNSSSGTILFIDRGSSLSIRLHLTVNNNQTVSMKARVSGSTLYTVTSSQTLPLDTWTHITGLIDITNEMMAIYISGELSLEDQKNFKGASGFANTNSINPCIGGISGSSSYPFTGMIDELALYNRVLNGTEIARLSQGLITAWSPTFSVNSLINGTITWNIEAKTPDNVSFWAPHDWSFSNDLLSAEYVTPTPSEGETINTSSTTIALNATNPLSSASLHLQKQDTVEKIFKISVNTTDWSKWGFKYPVTYEFALVDISDFEVYIRDSELEEWQPLPFKTDEDFFNGIEAVRLDPINKIAYVSVAFNTQPEIYLKFPGNASVTYQGVSLYYDNRKAVYTLSLDNWGGALHSETNAGVPCQSRTDDNGDKYQAAVWTCRDFNLPVSVAINTEMNDMTNVWVLIQGEIDAGGMEPSVHTRNHPCFGCGYQSNGGYEYQIIGCRDDLLNNLQDLTYGDYIFTFILPCGYDNTSIFQTSNDNFLLLREWNGNDNSGSTLFENWHSTYNFYYGAFETKSYDALLEARYPSARYYASDVNEMNAAFNTVYNNGGIFYAMWHPDRFTNSIIYDDREPVEGSQGSSLIQHLSHVSNRKDVWYVANGWLYNYRRAAEITTVEEITEMIDCGTFNMTIDNSTPPDHLAIVDLNELDHDHTYYFQTSIRDTDDDMLVVPSTSYRSFQVSIINDTEPPLISDATGDVPFASAGIPVTISATVTDNIGVVSVRIYYTPIGGTETHIDMNEMPLSDIWWAEVPVADNIGTIPYYIIGMDNAGNVGRNPETGNYEITVINNEPPLVSDIPDQTINEGETFTTISLDNYVNDPDNEDDEIIWTYSGSQELTVVINANRIATITIPSPEWQGSETITFTATDPGNLSSTNPATFRVLASEIEVFYDSFEQGTWNGKWTEDRQNDWFRGTERATDGIYTARVDGWARNAQLISVPIDLQDKTNVTITFTWYIERRLDSGEYLAFDVSTDGGSSWTKRAILRGNVDPEDQWHNESITLQGIQNLRLRFRGNVSRWNEDADVDVVKVVAR